MMSRFLFGGLCVWGLALYVTLGQEENPCAGAPDGKNIQLNCTGFTNCTNGKPVEVNCGNGTVVERDSFTCKPIGTGNTICGTSGICSSKGFQASPNCQSFFFCQDSLFSNISHIYCPGVLLFDGRRCNFPANVSTKCEPIK
ncbi:unnamed protein product [Candidula unifasciata]|uniref:Chitin-binding type-2 domain-containing protein n=1 Tax=Candidula unifasciata TaxID=100452 RepID=A0A8S3YH82_9EUPU|nr:unnamed protein product [Candidula unifasciata]